MAKRRAVVEQLTAPEWRTAEERRAMELQWSLQKVISLFLVLIPYLNSCNIKMFVATCFNLSSSRWLSGGQRQSVAGQG
jgi:hypothetical protein